MSVIIGSTTIQTIRVNIVAITDGRILAAGLITDEVTLWASIVVIFSFSSSAIVSKLVFFIAIFDNILLVKLKPK